YNESFQGEDRLKIYKAELEAFIRHTLSQKYNGETPPRLVIVSPIAFEDLSDKYDLPDGKQINTNLSMYAEAMEEVAVEHNVPFVDVFTPTRKWFENSNEPLTIDGSQLTSKGYKKFAELLADQVFGEIEPAAEAHRQLVHEAVTEKNWMWHKDYKIPNGVHAYGRRYKPYGPDNYPFEIAKLRQMTANRDTAIWQAARGEKMDLQAADAKTLKLPEVETNYGTDD